MIIAFSGVSGAGKTSIINGIIRAEVFAGRDLKVKGEDQFFLVGLAKKILGERMFTTYKREKFYGEKQTEGNLGAAVFRFAAGLIYPLVVYLDYCGDYLYYEVVYPKKILLKDRYIYDYLVTMKEVIGMNSWLYHWLYRMFPRPSLHFYVRVGVKTAIMRNKNKIKGMITQSDEFHQRVVLSYDDFFHKEKFLVIDGGAKVGGAVEQVAKHILVRAKIMKMKTVAVCGLDGSGKSTLVESLAEYCKKLNVSCRVVHFYHDNLLFKLLKKVGIVKIQWNEATRVKSIAAAKINREKGKSLMWAIVTFLDSYVQYLVMIITRRRGLIIFDRYFYDYLVSFPYLGIGGVKWFGRLIPKVDRGYLLAIHGEKAFARKPENLLVFFEEGEKKYLEVAKEYGLEIIDVSGKSRKSVLYEVINKLVKVGDSEINRAVVNRKDVAVKDKDFYMYLLRNSVAYYFATQISKKGNSWEKEIARVGQEYNKKYLKTLRLIESSCREEKIDFLLFKTYKYVPEVVDGDIDMIVRRKDFDRLMTVLTKVGFDCRETEPRKGLCLRKGFCPIEPRVAISFYGEEVVGEKVIWERTEWITYKEMKVRKVVREIDSLYFLLNVLYGPNYFKLYAWLVLSEVDLESLMSCVSSTKVRREVAFLYDKLVDSGFEQPFPRFLSNLEYLRWWLKKQQGLKQLLFFVYMKYRYKLSKKLVFQHGWGVK